MPSGLVSDEPHAPENAAEKLPLPSRSEKWGDNKVRSICEPPFEEIVILMFGHLDCTNATSDKPAGYIAKTAVRRMQQELEAALCRMTCRLENPDGTCIRNQQVRESTWKIAVSVKDSNRENIDASEIVCQELFFKLRLPYEVSLNDILGGGCMASSKDESVAEEYCVCLFYREEGISPFVIKVSSVMRPMASHMLQLQDVVTRSNPKNFRPGAFEALAESNAACKKLPQYFPPFPISHYYGARYMCDLFCVVWTL